VTTTDDFVLNVRQISQYPAAATTAATDVALIQQGGLGGPYAAITVANLVATALENGGSLHVEPGSGIAWNGASLTSDGVGFSFSGAVDLPALTAASITAAGSIYAGGDIFVAGQALATQDYVTALFDDTVVSFNGRSGFVQLETADVLRAGGAPIQDAHFGGFCTAPSPWDFRADSDQIATTHWVQGVIEALICGGSLVTSFNGRGGDVILTTADVNAAFAVPGPPFPTAANPALGDSSNRIATTLFVDESIADAISEAVFIPDLALYAPLASPAFSGIPTAPTANAGTSTGQIATTAFVEAAVVAATTGVTSFNTRTGAITLILADLTAAGGAPLVSPNFTGTPMAPTAPVGTSTQQLATTAFVLNEVGSIAAGVASFNGRSGIVTLTTADVTGAGGAPIASPNLTGAPTAPTPAPGNSSTALATTAFVAANSVLSFNGRQGAVSLTNNDVTAAGGAVVNSPAFTGTPTAPTAAPATSTTQLATTAFVTAAIAANPGGVTTFNGRAGAITLNATDVQGASGAVYRQSDTPPSATPNTFWYNSLNGQLYVQYVDPVTSATSWVVGNSTPAPPVTYSVNRFPATGAAGNGTTTAATFTTPANSSVNTIWKVKMCGAGGGGGGAGTGASYQASPGGGAEYKEFLLSGVAASTAISLAIGNAGLAGNAASSIVPGAGGNTSLIIGGGTNIVCAGGGGGINTAGTWQFSGRGGAGGATTPGTATVQMLLDINGGDGWPNNGQNQSAATGGFSMLGIPSLSLSSTSVANGYTVANGFGCGGAGAWTPPQTGFNGLPGIVIIERVAG
jgi:hypothetical protein